MKYNKLSKEQKLNNYIESLNKTNIELKDLVNVDNVLLNVSKDIIHLNTLNFIISYDEKIFKNNIEILFSENKEAFQVIPIIFGIKNREKKILYENNKFYDFNTLISNVEGIKKAFIESGIFKLIRDGKIKSFVDYVYGVNVGLDTHSRKNRSGNNFEILVKNYLNEFIKNNDDYILYEQQYSSQLGVDIPLLERKRIDFIIENKYNHKLLLIESSFYNASGSKISETARGYFDIHKEILNNENCMFIWLADGNGMSSIKKSLLDKIDDDYIYSFSTLKNALKKFTEFE